MTHENINKYLEVAVSAPIHRPLTYLSPVDHEQQLKPGVRVLVPLGHRKITGYILAAVDSAPPGQKIKEIYEVLDKQPLFPVEQVRFFEWIARYYHYPIGEVIKTALPAGLNKKSGRRVLLTEKGRIHVSGFIETETENFPWLSGLLDTGEINPHSTGKLWSTKDRRILESWEEEGWIDIISELTGGRTKTRTEQCCALTGHAESAKDLKVSEEKTIEVLKRIATATGRRFVPRREISREYSGAAKGLKSLLQKKIVIFEEQQVYRDPFGECFLESDVPDSLTVEQNNALNTIIPAINQGKYAPFLLHGVTGSGKTEVYLKAAEKTLKLGKSVLVLVPEIALATQIEAHFQSRFGTRVALLHSGLTSGQRFDQWNRIVQGRADVVIGARSAVFAPFPDPGLIIVDEEHDSSYKQDDGFRYHGRDLAVLRASQSDAVVILGSATPSVTSYYHANTGKYKLLKLEKRIEDRPLPTVEVIDMQSIVTVSGKAPVFSPVLVKNLRENLARGEQSLIFLNRRGFANFMICKDCGKAVECRHCQVSMTLHKGVGKLLCHYCGFTLPSKTVCANCQSTSLAAIGTGTERLEQNLAELLPGARLARLDRDTCLKRNDYLRVLKAVHKGETDILLGTQMITKGHHFPNVTLVGIVLADTGLGIPDFRAGERTFQLISQVTGRAGRGEKPGRVIVQTFQPDHHSIRMAQNHDYSGMYSREIELRKGLGYPPFSRLINIKIEGKDEKIVKDTAIRLAAMARKFQKKLQPEILGPAPAPLMRLRDRFRWQILLKTKKLELLHGFMNTFQSELSTFNKAGKVKISIDVDPEYMM